MRGLVAAVVEVAAVAVRTQGVLDRSRGLVAATQSAAAAFAASAPTIDLNLHHITHPSFVFNSFDKSSPIRSLLTDDRRNQSVSQLLWQVLLPSLFEHEPGVRAQDPNISVETE
jgi:hypothetical protein